MFTIQAQQAFKNGIASPYGQEVLDALQGTTSAGAVAAVSGLSVEEKSVGQVHVTTLTFLDMAVALTDNAGVVAYGGKKVYDWPEGLILNLGASADLNLTKSSTGVNADWDGDISLGTVTASNNATLLSTEANVIPSTSTPQAVAGVTTGDMESIAAAPTALTDSSSGTADGTIEALADLATAGGNTYTDAAVNAKLAILRNWAADFAAKINALILLAAGGKMLALDGTTTAPDLYLNILIDDADHDVTTTPCNIIVNGTLTFAWMKIGDN